MPKKNNVRACHLQVETLKSNGFSVRRIAFYGIRTRRTMPVACYPCFAFSPPPALYPIHSKYPWWISFDSGKCYRRFTIVRPGYWTILKFWKWWLCRISKDYSVIFIGIFESIFVGLATIITSLIKYYFWY